MIKKAIKYSLALVVVLTLSSCNGFTLSAKSPYTGIEYQIEVEGQK